MTLKAKFNRPSVNGIKSLNSLAAVAVAMQSKKSKPNESNLTAFRYQSYADRTFAIFPVNSYTIITENRKRGHTDETRIYHGTQTKTYRL